MVNREGSVYLDTTESNSDVSLKGGKYARSRKVKGGHVQVDIAENAQLEWNFNTITQKGARLGAESTKASPKTDIDLVHPDQPVSGSPSARGTSRTYMRAHQYDLFLKTSDMQLYCEDTGSSGKAGNFTLVAEDDIVLASQASGNSGDSVSASSSSAQVKITNTLVNLGRAAPVDFVMRGTQWDTAFQSWLTTRNTGITPSLLTSYGTIGGLLTAIQTTLKAAATALTAAGDVATAAAMTALSELFRIMAEIYSGELARLTANKAANTTMGTNSTAALSKVVKTE